MDFQRHVKWRPAYNKTGDGKGRGSMVLLFILVGEKGATQFVLFTGFDHSSDRNGYGEPGRDLPHRLAVMPADLGYHSRTPMYDKQPSMACAYIQPEARCYYDGSGLNAQDAFDVFTDEGEEALWRFLERYYDAVFNDGDGPPELGRRFRADMAAFKK